MKQKKIEEILNIECKKRVLFEMLECLVEYDIRQTDLLNISQDLDAPVYGMADMDKSVIYLSKSQDTHYKLRTLLHELGHIYLSKYNVMKNQEVLVNRLTDSMYNWLIEKKGEEYGINRNNK